MRIELRDIMGGDYAIGHLALLKPGATLGQLFDHNEPLRQVAACVKQVTVNGARVGNWAAVVPAKDDHIIIDIIPRFALVALPAILSYILTALSIISSIVQFTMSLFNKPQPPKLGAAPKQSQSYSWDGIKTSLTPGGPVPVNYGDQLLGGQLLALAIDIEGAGDLDGRNDRQTLSMLLGLGVGVITDVSCIKINGGLFSNFSDSSTWDWRPGYSSQSVISGFMRTRNTFADGREITSESITYTTIGNSISSVQLQVAAAQGLGKFTPDGGMVINTTKYSIEYKPTGATSWTIVESPRAFRGRSRTAIWDAPVLVFSGGPGAWDLRLRWLSTHFADLTAAPALYHIWLRNVTEVIDRTESFSGTGLLAIRAIATNQLNGNVPNITAVTKCLQVRAYSDETTYVTTWTRNPAWGLLDYMTNSRYGMGAFITVSMVNMQSFIDFASLCDSLVPNGVGSLEPQHCLDITMDKKKPHWTWVQDMLGLYRSATVYSQGKFKIISDRADLPVRQVFHACNIVPGTFQLTLGTADPIHSNQATVVFPNRNVEFNLDTLYIQDSASIYGLGDPIKEFEMSLIGVSRESEAQREGNWQLSRRRQQVREAQFKTGLEAIAVEPGDLCRVGIPVTDWELGYGGRIVDGSSAYAVLDRPIDVRSGQTYELIVWHTAADSLETRTLATTPGSGTVTLTTMVVSTTPTFGLPPAAGDRWALGVTSEDLMSGLVKSVTPDNEGGYGLVVQEYVRLEPVTPTIVSTGWWGEVPLFSPPPQPISVAGCATASVQRDGTVVVRTNIDVTPAPPEEGGLLTVPGTLASVTLGGSHAAPTDALAQEYIRFLTGSPAVLAYRGTITAWNNGGSSVATVSPVFAADAVPLSGAAYTIAHKAGNFAGFDLLQRSDEDSGYGFVATVNGLSYEAASALTSGNLVYKVIPWSNLGVRNGIGCWELTINPVSETSAPLPPERVVLSSHLKTLYVAAHMAPPVPSDFAGLDLRVVRTSSQQYFTGPQSLGAAAVWSVNACSLSITNSLPPTSYNAFLATEANTNTTHWLAQTRSLGANPVLKLQVDVRAGSQYYCALSIETANGSGQLESIYDVRSAAVGQLTTVGSGTLTERTVNYIGDAWHRVAIVGQVGSSATYVGRFSLGTTSAHAGLTYLGDSGNVLLSYPLLQTYVDTVIIDNVRVGAPPDTSPDSAVIQASFTLTRQQYKSAIGARVRSRDYTGNVSSLWTEDAI